MMPALLTRPCRAVSRMRKWLAAATTLARSIRSICRRSMLAEGCIFLMLVMAAVPFSGDRAHMYTWPPCSARWATV